jgi:Domain of unknown function (DUF4440)
MALEGPLAAEDVFFQALVQADDAMLDRVLADDFVIVDVMEGGVTNRADFLAAVSAGQVTFHRVDPTDRQVRRYDSTAVVIGRTDMSGAVGPEEFTIASRYTHVFRYADGIGWQLASAQGTKITR